MERLSDEIINKYIAEMRVVVDAHKCDAMYRDNMLALIELKQYRDTDLTPEQIRELKGRRVGGQPRYRVRKAQSQGDPHRQAGQGAQGGRLLRAQGYGEVPRRQGVPDRVRQGARGLARQRPLPQRVRLRRGITDPCPRHTAPEGGYVCAKKRGRTPRSSRGICSKRRAISPITCCINS